MKIKSITPLVYELVKFDEEYYRRYSKDCWQEEIYDEQHDIFDQELIKELENAYQEYLKRNPTPIKLHANGHDKLFISASFQRELIEELKKLV